MYYATASVESDKDLHRFVWRTSLYDRVKDFCMTKHQAELMHLILAAKAVDDASYVLIMGSLKPTQWWAPAGSFLEKDSNEPLVLQLINVILALLCHLSDPEVEYTKMLEFEVEYTKMLECIPTPLLSHSSKHSTSGRGDKESTSPGRCKNFRRLGWFPSTIVLVKIPLQRLWEEKRACDAPVPPAITQVEERAAACHIPRYTTIQGCQSCIHGLGDASQLDYAGVVYLRMIDEQGDIHTSMVISETKVAPVIRSTIPRLDLYGDHASCLP